VGVAHDQVELVDGVAAGVILRFDERRIAVVVLAGRGQGRRASGPPPGRDPHAEVGRRHRPHREYEQSWTVPFGPTWTSRPSSPPERAGGRRALRRVALAAPTFVFRESGSQSHGFPAIPEVKALTNEAVCGLLREAAENGPRVRAIGDRPQRSNNEDPGCRWGRHASSRTPRFLATDRRDHGACTARSGPERILRVARCRRAARQTEATVGTDPVTEFTPDVPGRYWIGLDAPDGDHRLTVHAFPSSYEGVDVEGGSGTEIRDRTAGNAPVDYAEPRGDGGVGRPRMRLDASVELGETDGDEEGGDEKGSDEKSSDEKSSDGLGLASPKSSSERHRHRIPIPRSARATYDE